MINSFCSEQPPNPLLMLSTCQPLHEPPRPPNIQEPKSQYLAKQDPAGANSSCTADISSHLSVGTPHWLLEPFGISTLFPVSRGNILVPLLGLSDLSLVLRQGGHIPSPYWELLEGKLPNIFPKSFFLNLSSQFFDTFR